MHRAAQPVALQRLCLLHGGDDYELVFTAPPGRADAVRDAGRRAGVAVTRIVRIEAEPGLWLQAADGSLHVLEARGFDHFAA